MRPTDTRSAIFPRGFIFPGAGGFRTLVSMMGVKGKIKYGGHYQQLPAKDGLITRSIGYLALLYRHI
jgi:hypothetical protein